jgi:hypothetical protein
MSRLAYCTLEDVKKRLYTASSQVNLQGANYTPSANPDDQRDSLLLDIVESISRRFDKETGRTPENFAPKYSTRLYSGLASQLFEIEEFVNIGKLEINLQPGAPASPAWTDYTLELGNGLTQARPLRTYPKTVLFRMNTFYQDPFLAGNVRIGAIWGNVQPDPDEPAPVGQDPAWYGLTDDQINALAPPDGGWWITPEDVRSACAQWAVYTFLAGRGGFTDVQMNPAGGGVTYRKGMPPEVSLVIDKYTRDMPKLAMVTMTGDDLGYEQSRFGTPDMLSRWAGWTTFTP